MASTSNLDRQIEETLAAPHGADVKFALIVGEGGVKPAPGQEQFPLAALDDLMNVVEQLCELEPDRRLFNDHDRFIL